MIQVVNFYYELTDDRISCLSSRLNILQINVQGKELEN